MKRIAVFASLFGLPCLAQDAAAQVIIGFGPAVAPAAVPLSPWMNVALALLLLGTVWAFLRKEKTRGFLLLGLISWSACFAVLASKEGVAGSPSPFALTSSPAHISTHYDYGLTLPACHRFGYVWVTSGQGTIVISTIDYDTAGGYTEFTPPTPTGKVSRGSPIQGPAGASVCKIGTVLTPTTSCIVWYQTTTGVPC